METQGGFLISQVKQLSGRAFERILAEQNIDAFNGAQGRILYILWQQDGISIRDLSRETGLAVTTLTSMLDRMEVSGLIRRIPDERDRRRTLLFLTEKSRMLQTPYDAVSAQMEALFYRGFSAQEIEAFESCLRRIAYNLTV